MSYYNISYQDIIMINLWGQKIIEDEVKVTEGIRDANLLHSIPKAICQSFSGEELYPTVYDKSSYIWYTLSQYHCFIDGNKRTALVTMIIYLNLNGYEIDFEKTELLKTCICIANGEMNQDQIKEYIMKNSHFNNCFPKKEKIIDLLSLLSSNEELVDILKILGT